jgi:hypothetical protein
MPQPDAGDPRMVKITISGKYCRSKSDTLGQKQAHNVMFFEFSK